MNPLEKLIRTAYNTFSARAATKLRTIHLNDSIPALSVEEQAEITGLLNECSSEDVGLHQSISRVGKRHGNSISYIEIANNKWFSLGIFVLRPGNRIPLHNHPNMFGALKVIYGEVRVTSYTLTQDRGKEVIAVQEPTITLSTLSPPAVLFPDQGNIHEVEFVQSGPPLSQYNYAAFIDFLTPPYEEPEDKSVIPCQYYQVKESNTEEEIDGEKVFTLVKRPTSPPEYSSADAPYMGTSLEFISQLEKLYPASCGNY